MGQVAGRRRGSRLRSLQDVAADEIVLRAFMENIGSAERRQFTEGSVAEEDSAGRVGYKTEFVRIDGDRIGLSHRR